MSKFPHSMSIHSDIAFQSTAVTMGSQASAEASTSMNDSTLSVTYVTNDTTCNNTYSSKS
jgi:hypothetical protein